MDPAFNEDQPKFWILILPIPLQMLPDSHCLLYQVIQVLRNLRGKTVSLQDTQYLAASNALDLCNAMRVTEKNTNLRWRQPLLSKLADVFIDFLGGDLEPARRSPLVRKSWRGNTLSVKKTNVNRHRDGKRRRRRRIRRGEAEENRTWGAAAL